MILELDGVPGTLYNFNNYGNKTRDTLLVKMAPLVLFNSSEEIPSAIARVSIKRKRESDEGVHHVGKIETCRELSKQLHD